MASSVNKFLGIHVGSGDQGNRRAGEREGKIGWVVARSAQSRNVRVELANCVGMDVVIEGTKTNHCVADEVIFALTRVPGPRKVTVRLHRIDDDVTSGTPLYHNARALADELRAAHVINDDRLHVVPTRVWRRIKRRLVK